MSSASAPETRADDRVAGRFTIIVTFDMPEANLAAFLPLMLENAETSRRVEPGCERFDVLRVPALPGRIVLYEIYRDRAAFDAHCMSDHFKRFDAATTHLVTAKEVTVLDLLAQP